MYKPNHFNEQDDREVRKLISASPLGTFIIAGPEGISANHIPFVLDGRTFQSSRLWAHVPRANPLCEMLSEPRECLVIFHGPQGYISPSYYATKQAHGRVVPTWNYAVVHCQGLARRVQDKQWIQQQIALLTTQQEEPRSTPWEVEDAPPDYIGKLIAALVGIEVSITHVDAKTKASQNQVEENQHSVLQHLESEGTNEALRYMMQRVLQR